MIELKDVALVVGPIVTAVVTSYLNSRDVRARLKAVEEKLVHCETNHKELLDKYCLLVSEKASRFNSPNVT